MESLPTVVLKPGEADRVLAGHPWIYEGSVLRLSSPIESGSQVQVKDHRQRFLGIGFYNARSRIRVRLVGTQREWVNQVFFEGRIRAALQHRLRHLPGAGSFRVVNSESDFLSGLIVDKYEDVLVVQISSLGMDRRKGEIVAALQAVLGPRAIVERSDTVARGLEGLAVAEGVLAGTPAGAVTVKLNGLLFPVDPLSGHKTGLYLDQQVNYQLVADLARRVEAGQGLDCFCFQGAFALHLGRAGVGRVHGVEQGAETVEQAGQNARINGLADRCSFEAANVFDWLKNQTTKGPHEKLIPRFDVIVLDPPSFTRHRSSVPDALRGYKEIHLRALRLLKAGGLLASFCCSHHVDGQTFLDVILSAAFDARRVLRRVSTLSQSPDHPVLPAVPETEYLKGFCFEVAR